MVAVAYGNKYLYPDMNKCCDPSWYSSDRIIAPCEVFFPDTPWIVFP